MCDDDSIPVHMLWHLSGSHTFNILSPLGSNFRNSQSKSRLMLDTQVPPPPPLARPRVGLPELL